MATAIATGSEVTSRVVASDRWASGAGWPCATSERLAVSISRTGYTQGITIAAVPAHSATHTTLQARADTSRWTGWGQARPPAATMSTAGPGAPAAMRAKPVGTKPSPSPSSHTTAAQRNDQHSAVLTQRPEINAAPMAAWRRTAPRFHQPQWAANGWIPAKIRWRSQAGDPIADWASVRVG